MLLTISALREKKKKMKHSEYVEVVKTLMITSLKNSLISIVIDALPFLATGPLNAVLIKLATVIAEKMADKIEMAVFFQYVDFRTDQQAQDFELAMVYNHHIQQSGTEEEKKDAEAKLMVALNNLVTFSK